MIVALRRPRLRTLTSDIFLRVARQTARMRGHSDQPQRTRSTRLCCDSRHFT
jgi:hypothetical protein